MLVCALLINNAVLVYALGSNWEHLGRACGKLERRVVLGNGCGGTIPQIIEVVGHLETLIRSAIPQRRGYCHAVLHQTCTELWVSYKPSQTRTRTFKLEASEPLRALREASTHSQELASDAVSRQAIQQE